MVDEDRDLQFNDTQAGVGGGLKFEKKTPELPEGVARDEYPQPRPATVEWVMDYVGAKIEGVYEFTELNDTPGSYIGFAGKFLSVKSNESGLEFTTVDFSPYVLKSGSITQIATRLHNNLQTIGIDDHHARDHQASHITGGADIIPVATISAVGLLPILSNAAGEFLNGLGSWVAIDLSPYLKYNGIIQATGILSYNFAPNFTPGSNQIPTVKFVEDSVVTQNEFVELTDTPGAYAGSEGLFVQVHPSGTSLMFSEVDLSPYLKHDGSIAMTSSLDMGIDKIINLVDPTADQEAATKKYVDDNIGGGGKAVLHLLPGSAKLPNAGFARITKITRVGSNPDCVDNVMKFNANGDDSDEYVYFQFVVPDFYVGGNLTVTIYSASNDTNAGAPTADLHFDVMMLSDDEPLDTTFTAIGTNAIGMGSAAYDVMVDTIAWTSNKPTAGDFLKIRVWVDESDSNLAVDLEVLAIKIEED